MGLTPLPTPVAPILTEAEHQAATARFWELVGRSTDLDVLLALREAMREYERLHAQDELASPLGTSGEQVG